MKIYIPKNQVTDDYSFIRRNGMWYVHWQSGYLDILKKGYPKPDSDETILAELYSPNVDDFLHGSTPEVPFIISDTARLIFQKNSFSGFRLANVEITKIATKGNKRVNSKAGEPEDLILRSKSKLAEVNTPNLYAVYVTGKVSVVPDYPSGRSPIEWVSPFNLDVNLNDIPDLFRPYYDNKPFSSWVFCSERFVNAIAGAELTNIVFESFDKFMGQFREKTQNEIKNRSAGQSEI